MPLNPDWSTSSLLLRYYDQLCAVEPKFPFSENQVECVCVCVCAYACVERVKSVS